MTTTQSFEIIFSALLCVSCMQNTAQPTSQERPLSSRDEHQSADSQQLRQLVNSFRSETLIRIPGPPAYNTPASRTLLAHGASAVPYLLEGLTNPDPNIRRHSAFVLAQLRMSTSLDPLKAASEREFEHLRATGAAQDPRATAPLEMMIIAMSRVSPAATLEWLAQGGNLSIRERYRSIAIIVNDPPVCGSDSDTFCRDRLRRWWSRHRARPQDPIRQQPWLAN